MKLSIIRPGTPTIVNGRPRQITAMDYILVDAIDLRGTWKVQDICRYSRRGWH